MARVIGLALCCSFLLPAFAHAEAPVASYVFPAGGQRGTTVKVRVGGLFLHSQCGLEMLGTGVSASGKLSRMPTIWFEGSVLPLPDSQRAEDYPKDMAGHVSIAADAPLGTRYWRLWTAQGATPAKMFVVGDLPEIVEDEIEGMAVPVSVQLPVTINGRIFPREDVDAWSVAAKKGETFTCDAMAQRLGSPLEARLEVLDPQGRRLAESNPGTGPDPRVSFTAPADGVYQVRIHDVSFQGSQAHVYRLTLTRGPYVERIFPLGGKRGGKTSFVLTGQHVPEKGVDIALPARGEFVWQQVDVRGVNTNPFLIDLDDLPEHVEPRAEPVAAPCVCNGRIAKAGEVDAWILCMQKGETIDMDLRAARLGSLLDGILIVTDDKGKELARAEGTGLNQPEPALRFTAPADGTYKVLVQDRFRSRGGPEFAYRLRLSSAAAPDFRLKIKSDAVTLLRGSTAKLPVQVERLGNFSEPITLTLEGLPKGIAVSNTTIAPKQNAVDIILKADADATIGGARITLQGTAKVGTETITRTAGVPVPLGQLPLESLLVGVGMATPFKIKGEYEMRWASRGATLTRKFKIERMGYDGPLEVALADRQARHLQGVVGPTITVPAGATEFSYTVQLPPWMETGRTCRVCVMGVARIKTQDGVEHEVSFSSTNQNEQMVAVVEPGKLAIAVDQASVAAAPGKSVTVPFRITRAVNVKGAVKVEAMVPAHMKGLAFDPAQVAAEQTVGSILLRFGPELRGPFTMPLLLRATLMEDGRPIVAEASIDIVQ